MSDITALRFEVQQLREELHHEVEVLEDRLHFLTCATNNMATMVSEVTGPKPAPAVPRDASAGEAAIDDRSYARLEYDYNEQLRSRKRQKKAESVDWLLKMES